MSQSSAVRVSRPEMRPGGRAARPVARPLPPPRLRVVAPPRHSRARAGLVLLCGALLVGGLVVLLLMNISLSHGSYEISQLEAEQQRLAEQRQELQERLQREGAPEQLAERARELGMVPADQPDYVRVAADR